MLCSFHNERHKRKKLKYKENLPVKEQRITGKRINNKKGYIKADQLYYFDKSKIVTKFPPNFFTNLTPYIPTSNEKKHDKPFKWSKNVLNGKAKIKLVSLSK